VSDGKDSAATAPASSIWFSLGIKSPSTTLDLTLARFPLPSEVFDKAEKFWLTLYVAGDPTNYEAAKESLAADGWENLCSAADFGGFSYPKKQVLADVAQVAEALRSALAICNKTGMIISVIAADTAFDPKQSTFVTLYNEQ
jgi:hypothetical protein